MTTTNSERPLVTFALFAYNQERFIREAVEGAFAQTYSPLEIILSDDCSPDKTYEIMQEMAAAYRGPHTVRLNQTVKNGGLAAHINSVMALAAGEFVVVAAGDDISLHQRAEILTREWLKAGKPSGIASAVKNIDEQGALLGPSEWASALRRILENNSREKMLRLFVQSHDHTMPGCSAAWSKENWNKFGTLMGTVINEDSALTFRSILDRGIYIILEPLVLYRTHAGNIWNARDLNLRPTPAYYKKFEETTAKQATMIWRMYENSLLDLKTAVSKQMISPTTAQAIETDISRRMRQLDIQAKWWNLSFVKRFSRLSDSPRRNFPLNLSSLLPLRQHAALWCQLARVKRKMSGSKPV